MKSLAMGKKVFQIICAVLAIHNFNAARGLEVRAGTILSAPAPAQAGAPDLLVKEIVFEKSPSKIRVRVLNQGSSASSSCYLALQSMIGNDASLPTKQRVWTIQVPALDTGKGFSSVIDVAPLTQTQGPWSATIDRSNAVAESNETNNMLRYPPSDSGNPGPLPPNWHRPDLVITQFELTDPSKGQVKIEVTNKGRVNSRSCTLRLIIWEQGKFEKKEARTVFVNVKAIQTGQSTTVIAEAGVPIISTRYSMYIDIGNEVAETNENNNRAEGEAGHHKP